MRARPTFGRRVASLSLVAAVLGAAGTALAARAIAVPTLPPPRFGRSVDIGLVSGTVIVTTARGHSFSLGSRDRNIPVGSRIDATHGRVDLRSAPPPSSRAKPAAARVQDAQFYDGAFRVEQSSATPVAKIILSGGTFASCTATKSHLAPRRKLPNRAIRLLHAAGPGRFETVGRYAAATVRGTVWLTEDLCDGTLVRVSAGVVAVQDLVTHGTVTIHAGHSFFARAG